MELTRIETWLYEALSDITGLATLAPGGVHHRKATVGTAYPFITFHSTAPVDMPSFGNSPRAVVDTYLVKAIAPGQSSASLEPLCDAIDAALEKASASVAGASVRGCIGIGAFEMEELDDGVTYQHLGRYYRVIVQAE